MPNPILKYSQIPPCGLEEFHSDNWTFLEFLDSETVWQLDNGQCQSTKTQHHCRIGGSIVSPAKLKMLKEFKG